MGGKPKVKQTNFVPPDVKSAVPTESDLAFQTSLQQQLKVQQDAYQAQLAGMSDQFRAQQDNSNSLLGVLNQQLDATKKKAADDAVLLQSANDKSAEQATLVDAQRGATQAKALDDMSSQRGMLGLLKQRQPTKRSRSLLRPMRGY